MLESLTTDDVRRCVAAEFARRGWNTRELRETILLASGNYCGRRFAADRGYADWLIDELTIAIFDDRGTILGELPLGAPLAVRRAA
jgi:hypothetical protein